MNTKIARWSARLIYLVVRILFFIPLMVGNAFAITYVNTGLPIVRVTTTDTIGSIDRENWVAGTITITSPDSQTVLYSGTITTKGRGNATWDMPKKGYRIKLDSKPSTPVLGMPADTQWVLIANYADRSLIRYYAALDLSSRINTTTGNPVWTPRMQYCELYWNDQYRGK